MAKSTACLKSIAWSKRQMGKAVRETWDAKVTTVKVGSVLLKLWMKSSLIFLTDNFKVVLRHSKTTVVIPIATLAFWRIISGKQPHRNA